MRFTFAKKTPSSIVNGPAAPTWEKTTHLAKKRPKSLAKASVSARSLCSPVKDIVLFASKRKWMRLFSPANPVGTLDRTRGHSSKILPNV